MLAGPTSSKAGLSNWRKDRSRHRFPGCLPDHDTYCSLLSSKIFLSVPCRDGSFVDACCRVDRVLSIRWKLNTQAPWTIPHIQRLWLKLMFVNPLSATKVIRLLLILGRNYSEGISAGPRTCRLLELAKLPDHTLLRNPTLSSQ